MKSHHRIAIASAALLLAASIQAHEGHDDAPVAPVSAGATPAIEAHSDLFELSGSVEHGALTLFLDRYADNAPVRDATIEIESGKEKGVAIANPDGSYTFKSALFAKPAPLSLTFTVTAGKDADLLAADLAPPAAHANAGRANAGHIDPAGRWRMTPLAIAATAALALMATLAARFALRRRNARIQGSHA